MQRRMKQAAVGAGAVMSLLLLVGCSADGSMDRSEGPQGLHTPGTLRACLSAGYPPMEYYENGVDGEVLGIDADGVRALGELWDVNVEIEDQAFEGLVPALQADRCDILWSGLYMSADRLEVLDGAPYMVTGPALAVRLEDEGKYKRELDLCGGSFGVQSGGAIAGVLQELSDRCSAVGKSVIDISQYPQPNDAIASVKNAKLDGIVETDIALQLMVEQAGGLTYVDGIFPAETQFGVFTSKGSPLVEPLAEGIAELIDSGEMGRILDEYGLPADRLVASE